MAIRYTREEVSARLSVTLAAKKPLVVAGTGTGLSAKCAELGGADLIVIYNSGKFRMDGLPSVCGIMCYSNANDVVYEMGERQVLPVVKQTPVIAGVCGTDPTREMGRFLGQLVDVGFSGVINFPTVGRIDGSLRRDLEAVGLGFGREVEMIAKARGQGLYTMAYVYSADEAREMAHAGVDVVIPHVGLTVGGTIGAKQAMSLEEAAKRVQEMLLAAREVNPEVVVLAHGGPIAEPDDVAYILAGTDSQGFVGASSMERLPVEKAIVGVMQKFKGLTLR
ncbi:MAG: phosphoenolpyruvate hydrolase family protein [Chloroflexi bacterium]|nr:phosphoenolpyruvate hydrolase family protein [Chloroflexota bacterium]